MTKLIRSVVLSVGVFAWVGGAWAGLPGTDNFTDTNGVNLGSHSGGSCGGTCWTVPVDTANLQVDTNAVKANVTTTSNAVGYWNADAFNNDQYCQAVVTWSTGVQSIGVAVRLDASGNGYGAYYVVGNGQAQIYKITNDGFGHLSASQIDADGSPWSSGDTMRLEISNTTLTLKKNGATTKTTVDATYTSGSGGIFGNGAGNTMLLDNIECGNLAAAGPPAGGLMLMGFGR